jgi:hypothetical protein
MDKPSIRSLRPAALALAMALACPAPSPAGEPPVTLAVLEDSFAHGLSDTTPQGADTHVDVCPVVMYWIYLKFDVSGFPGGIADAELRLNRSSGARPEEISIFLVADDSWTEAAMTGATRPEPTMPDNGDALGLGSDQGTFDSWNSPALTAAIQAEAAGDGVLTVMLRENPDVVFDVRRFFSKEGASGPDEAPRLVVTPAPVPVELSAFSLE